MAIDLMLAETLTTRLKELRKNLVEDKQSAGVFILNGLFCGLNQEVQDKRKFINILNFLYQICISEKNFQSIVLEQLQLLPIFKDFAISIKDYRVYLAPKAFQFYPGILQRYHSSKNVIQINLFCHSFDVRINEKLKELETEEALRTMEYFGTTPEEIETVQACRKFLEFPSFLNRFRLVRDYDSIIKRSGWIKKPYTFYCLSENIFIKLALFFGKSAPWIAAHYRWRIHVKNCFKLLFISKRTLLRAEKKFSGMQIRLHQMNQEVIKRNEAVHEWESRYHTEICNRVKAVTDFLENLGYKSKEEDWWY